MVRKALAAKTSNSLNHFIDTNVLLRHANDDAGEYSGDIATILADATGLNPKRTLWISSIIFAELRPSTFKPGKFETLDALVSYINSVATVIDLMPPITLRAARLRDVDWQRSPDRRQKDEKVRRMTLGDAIHITSALYVKEECNVPDLEFLTLDNKADSSVETDAGTKSAPLLTLEEFAHEISEDRDVFAAISLRRVKPMLSQSTMGV